MKSDKIFQKNSCARRVSCYFDLVLGGTEARRSNRCDGLQLFWGSTSRLTFPCGRVLIIQARRTTNRASHELELAALRRG